MRGFEETGSDAKITGIYARNLKNSEIKNTIFNSINGILLENT